MFTRNFLNKLNWICVWICVQQIGLFVSVFCIILWEFGFREKIVCVFFLSACWNQCLFCVIVLYCRIRLLVMQELSLPEQMISKWEGQFLAVLTQEWMLSISRSFLSTKFYLVADYIYVNWKSKPFSLFGICVNFFLRRNRN